MNERGNIAPLVARLDAALVGLRWEAIVVDDNSADGTAEAVRKLAQRDRRIRVIERFGRRGLASAAIEGMCATAAPFVAVMDADHQHDPAVLRAMLESVREGHAEVAIGSRFAEGADADGLADTARQRVSVLANALARRITGTRLTDPMSGFFLLRTDLARNLAPRLSGLGFKILLDILAAAPAPLRVSEFPIRFGERLSGASKLDRAVAFEFLVGIYDRLFGRVIPTRYALFGTVGALGVLVHLAVLGMVFRFAGEGFAMSQGIAVLAAMTFNFWLNNWLTYRDQRLSGFGALFRGWLGFCAACSVGAFANVAAASLLEARGVYWALAALTGIMLGSVWNYALSSRFVWGRFR